MADIDVSRTCLFLDLDGTLIDIAPRPDAVVVPDDLIALLDELRQRLNGAVAVVSGRPLADLARLLPDCPVPLVAEHGAVFRLPPEFPPMPLHRHAVPGAMAAQVRQQVSGLAGVLLEEKQSCLTVHFRLAPEQEPAVRSILEQAARRWPGFRIAGAKMALELRPRGLDKGTAVRQLIRHPPFRGRTPVFIGDDITDEDGIRACLLLGGRGLRVPGDFGGGPAAVRAWLKALVSPASPEVVSGPP